VAVSAAAVSTITNRDVYATAFAVQYRNDVGHGMSVHDTAADRGDGRVHGRTCRLAKRPVVVVQATDGLRPRVLPDRPKPVRVLRYEDYLRCGGRQRLTDSARCVRIYYTKGLTH